LDVIVPAEKNEKLERERKSEVIKEIEPTVEKLYGQPRTINSIDVSTKNPQILALNEIISKCQNQGIKLILFTN